MIDQSKLIKNFSPFGEYYPAVFLGFISFRQGGPCFCRTEDLLAKPKRSRVKLVGERMDKHIEILTTCRIMYIFKNEIWLHVDIIE